jgi:hypothetical protein
MHQSDAESSPLLSLASGAVCEVPFQIWLRSPRFLLSLMAWVPVPLVSEMFGQQFPDLANGHPQEHHITVSFHRCAGASTLQPSLIPRLRFPTLHPQKNSALLHVHSPFVRGYKIQELRSTCVPVGFERGLQRGKSTGFAQGDSDAG